MAPRESLIFKCDTQKNTERIKRLETALNRSNVQKVPNNDPKVSSEELRSDVLSLLRPRHRGFLLVS